MSQNNQKRIILTVKSKSMRSALFAYWRDRIVEMLATDDYIILQNTFTHGQDFRHVSDEGVLNFHGKMLFETLELLPKGSYCLILDNDAFPLSRAALDRTFELAITHGLSGNIQRTNCIENGGHLFIGPSYLCVSVDLVRELGYAAWVTNERSDTAEEIVWRTDVNINEASFKPVKTKFKPIWTLDGSSHSYGVGTYFADEKDNVINYHHFFSRIFVARAHFFVVSFFEYLRIRRSAKLVRSTPRSMSLRLMKHDLVTSLKYLFGRIS